MSMYCYTRVSTGKQSNEGQEQALLDRFPNAVVVKETASGIKKRPALERLIRSVQPGDTIAVAALDRLGRRTSEILHLIEELQKRQINVISLREGVDYSTPVGRLVTQILISVSEMERNLIADRTREALRMLKRKGVKLGRPAVYPPEVYARAEEMKAAGYTGAEIHEELGLSQAAISKMFGRRREPVKETV